MFKVRAGIATGNNLTEYFDGVADAMDFADMLHGQGFCYSEVLDSDGNLEYCVEDYTPRAQPEREQRRDRAKAFIKSYNEEKAGANANG